MDPEAVINLFDFYWFNHEILTKDPNVSCAKTGEPELKFSSLRSILVRSQSDDIGSSFNYGPFSPTTVLKPLVPSRKQDYAIQKQEQEQEQVTEVVQESDQTPKILDQIILDQINLDHIEQREMKKKKNKKRRHGSSKSLSDLEFEELKGFMDMGFVFSEQDKDSSLIKILPGLQRLGEDDGDGDGDDDDGDGGGGDGGGDGGGRTPYLSEAWDELDRKLKKKEDKKVPPVVMKWEIPVVGDEVDMKDNLKLWAHTVASIVR